MIFDMPVAIVIPARFASSRLPAKPLLRETGKYLVQHVYERAAQVKSVSTVIVATDDHRIRSAVESFGGRVMMTRVEHVSGTDRVAEVAASLTEDVIVNVQGDEPLFDPVAVEQLIEMMRVPGTDMATLAVRITDAASYRNPNVVKVVCDDSGKALYFSRSPLPFVRDREPDFAKDSVLQHLGVYAYRRDYLLKITTLPPHPLEQAEKLEQLRVLGNGGTLRVGVVKAAHRGVDTPEDYAAFVRAITTSTPETQASELPRKKQTA
jgi:3-deoxy-manno-octulosonate cytidylyltransferase (CMP-KDO synthetase)